MKTEMKHHVFFQDMHNDGLSKVVEITKEEFDKLKPFEADMENCNPFKFFDLLWDDIYARDGVLVKYLHPDHSLTATIC